MPKGKCKHLTERGNCYLWHDPIDDECIVCEDYEESEE